MSSLDTPALHCAKHFKNLMRTPDRRGLAAGWMKSSRFILDTYSLTPDELKEFMTWAAKEHTDPKPQFNSVEYLAKSTDPMRTLVKNAPGLIRFWRGTKKTSNYARSEKKSGTPMPKTFAHGIMVGYGINTPVEGWESPRQKMDAAKLAWYGTNYQNQPDPLTEDEMDSTFKESPASSKSDIGCDFVFDKDIRPCIYCRKPYRGIMMVALHIRDTHPEKLEEFLSKPFDAEPESKNELKDWKPDHICPYCPHIESDLVVLDAHARKHCKEATTPGTLLCPTCETEFPAKEVLYHMCPEPTY